jgi:KipI family sensor histidine kinase inhibitor
LDSGLTERGFAIRDVAEGAVLVEYPEASEEEANQRAVVVARSLATRAPAGFFDAVPGACNLLVLFDPRRMTRERLAEEVRRGAREAERANDSRRVLQIPVFYEAGPATGPDLEDLARSAGIAPEEVARRHAAAEYRVAFLGFAPGFPYMTGLARELHAPRLATPRTRVPAGSVGIGGRYTGIYPEETPGGWRLIGRAPVRLFDAKKDPPSLLLPGDRVRFQPIPGEEFERRLPMLDRAEPVEVVSNRPVLTIALAGVLTSVQGAPRRGWAIYGVPPGGAMDPETLARGNALVGNPPSAPALEMTLVGPELEFVSEAVIVLSGGRLEAQVNGRPLPEGNVCSVRAGDSVRVGSIRGAARAYLCVAGGLAETERPQLSRRLGPGDVVFLDTLPRSSEGSPARTGPSPAGLETQGEETRVRVLAGPQRGFFDPEGLATFLRSPYRVSASSDRRGIRLEGPAIVNRESPEIPPEGTALGGIQVPGDGQPIILGPDRPVTGGYAKIATVFEGDFPRVARAAPGSVLRFEEVSLADLLPGRLSE